jgi:hypothetical protein
VQVRLRTSADPGDVLLVVGEESLALPAGALDAVMRRFGKPLEDAAPRAEETLDLGGGRSLARFRFLRRYDVIARDYLVYAAPGEEPLCEMATTVAGALEHLARRFSRDPSPA